MKVGKTNHKWQSSKIQNLKRLIKRTKREEEMDLFETAYNFRFEDPNAATITSHARNALA